jgi:hypothetical protein
MLCARGYASSIDAPARPMAALRQMSSAPPELVGVGAASVEIDKDLLSAHVMTALKVRGDVW